MATNPRNRNLVQQAAHATQRARMPAVPTVRSADPKVDEAFRVIQEVLAVRTGSAGNPWERWLTGRDLQEMGLMGGLAGAIPSDAVGFPVWTPRQKYQLVTLQALASAVTALIPSDPNAVTVDDIAVLRQQIAQVSTGVTQAQLAAAIAQVLVRIGNAQSSALDSLESELQNAIALVNTSAEQAQAAADSAAQSQPTPVPVEIHLGIRPRRSFKIDFDADVLEGNVIRMQADPSVGGDELEMDMLTVAAECRRDGYITAYITATPGPVCGLRSFFYQVG